MTIATTWVKTALWKRVLIALLLGALLGMFLPSMAPRIAFLGEVFVRLIRMLVVPVVFFTIASGVASLGDPKRLGSVGVRTIGLFGFTTFVAVALGMLVAVTFEPGVGAKLGAVSQMPLGAPKSTHDQLVGIVPLNVIAALTEGDMLAIIFFSFLVGIGATLAGTKAAPLVTLLDATSAVLFQIVRLVMEVTPFGVLSLTASAVAANGVNVFHNIGWLAICVVLGSAAQMIFVHGLIVRVCARLPFSRFLRATLDALMVAFSTASSSATLPIAMRVAQTNLGVSQPIASTVLPLGASIGKDGTAMYVGLLSVFSLQVLDVPPSLPMLGVMWFTGALAAFGTAPVPSASLFMLAAVLGAAGISPEQTALVVGLVLPFDRLLDMTRTVPSASANLAVAATIARWVGE